MSIVSDKHKIAFHLSHFSIRGSEVAVYDYAHYNEKILGNKSVIVVNSDFKVKKDYRGEIIHDDDIYKKFVSRFEIIEYNSKDDLCKKLREINTTIFYNLKSGENDNFVIDGVKNVCHSIFTFSSDQIHGDIYIPISLSIVDKDLRDITPYVPHMVEPLPNINTNLRSFLKIPDDAIVFGRHGGEETFNIPFVREAVIDVATSNPNIYFLFLNTQMFTSPRNNIIFIQKLSDPIRKSIFINTCDAMIHGRKEGESFGFSVAEFSIAKKPIITWKHNRSREEIQKDFDIKIDVEHTHHIDILGDSGIYYEDKKSLIHIFKTFLKHQAEDKYTDLYSPEKVMDLFNKHIINVPYSRMVKLTTFEKLRSDESDLGNPTFEKLFEKQKYVHYINDDLAKSLLSNGWEPHVYNIIKSIIKSTDTFIDIGSNIGYHTIRVAQLLSEGKVISIEPCKPIVDLLNHNIKINNLKNVMSVMTGLFSTNKSLYYKDFDRTTTNFGDIKMTPNESSNCIRVECVDLDYLIDGQSNVNIIKIDVSGNEVDVIKGGIKTIMKYRPYIIVPFESKMFKNNSCLGLKHLISTLGYSIIEIHSDYPCDHLCYPSEKKSIIENLFIDRIEGNIPNSVNDNHSLGIVTRIAGKKINPILGSNPIRVKLMCNWMTGEELCKCWEKMSKGNCIWNNIHVVYNDIDIDYYVIINKPLPGDKYIPEKTMVFRMEPDTSSTSSRWSDWYTNTKNFMYFFDLGKYRNNTEWHLGMSYKQLHRQESIPKSKTISSVISSLYQMEGHRKRVDFVKYCQSQGLEIDVYGRDNLHNFKNHKGELPYHNKNEGILPYKYTFIAENCSLENYFTEKIVDAILGETLCFYWGCPNIDSFIDPRAYIVLDLNDMKKSYNTIVSAINNNEWANRLPYIMKEKDNIISHYSFFPRIEGYIHLSKLDCKVVNLDHRIDRLNDFITKSNIEDFSRYTRFSAVNGSKLIINDDIKSLFQNFNHRRPKRGEVGCCMSHLSIWKNLTNDTLVLEDDISLCKGFQDKLSLVYRHVKENHPLFDILYIGYHINKDVSQREISNYDNKYVESFQDIINETSTLQHPFGAHGGGTFAYIISPNGAKKLINNLIGKGFLFPVDYQMLLTSKTKQLQTYCCVTPLVTSDMFENNSNVDTDIQKTDTI